MEYQQQGQTGAHLCWGQQDCQQENGGFIDHYDWSYCHDAEYRYATLQA